MIPLRLSHPLLAAQLHPTRNEGVNLDKISAGSKKKVWWSGDCSHEWEASILNRSTSNTGCPYCAGKKILIGFNDFKSQAAESLIAEWHPKLNNFSPDEISYKANTKVWWIDSFGHEWQATINSRTMRQSGCPVCKGNAVVAGNNDLATLYPHLIAEWHPTKNGKDKPHEFRAASNKKVWWIDNKGHEWEASIDKRSLANRGCPYCSGNKALSGFNDLATLYPNLAAEMDSALNSGMSAQDITIGSKQKIWWKCSLGHNWKVAVCDRVGYQTGCPICANKKVLPGFNDFASAYPSLALEWNRKKNGTLLPTSITSGSNLKVWWKCSKNHEWEATALQRSLYGYGCPFCSNLVSKEEQKIVDFLQSHNIQLIQSERKILSGIELDIYIPDKKIAIEFNGVYWHSELFKQDTMYHHNKWLQCKQRGIQLIQIWEDEWRKNPDQIKSMLLHKLKVASGGKHSIYARQTKIVSVDTKSAKSFYDKFHIQGFASSSCYYGLEQNGILYAVIALKKESGNVLNIIRYATSHNVVGGFTKLLKYAENTLDPSAFITFSDHCVSDGGLYESNGFIVDKELPPDYRYVWRGERKHKFGYRLSRFKNDPSLIWNANMTEKELANLNGLYRIWDAGKTKWKKRIK